MENKLYLGKADAEGRGRNLNRCYITWELKDGKNGPEFSAQAEAWQAGGRDICMCGQCVDDIAAMFPENEKAQRICAIWKQYHLNHMKAGLSQQEAFITEWEKTHKYDYTEACKALQDAGLYCLPVPEGVKCCGDWPEEIKNGSRGYRYGERWIYSPIPADILEEIKSW